MMKAFDIPVYGPSKNVPQDDAERTVNMYPEKVSDDTYTLKARPGHVVVGQFGFAGDGRGQVSVGGRLFGVRGYSFCEFVDGESVTRGTLVTNEGRCALTACLPPNGEGQILIVGPDNEEGYAFEIASNTFTTLTEGAHGFVGGGGQCVFFGGRAWAIKKGTGQFQCSDLYDFLSWPGDAFGTAEFDSDELLALETDGNYLLLLGKQTGEVWGKADTLPLPVSPTTTTFKVGILAPQAHFCFEDDFYWFGGNAEGRGAVYRLQIGGQPQIVSDYSTNRNIAPLADQASAFMYAYQSIGHRFIFLTFGQAGRTFVYDISEGLWHEENVRLSPSGVFTALLWNSVIFHDGKLIGLNRNNGEISEIREDVFTDNGLPIVLDRILPVFPNEASWRSFYQSIELFNEMGNTPVTDESTSENVVVGTTLASEPVLTEDARFVHVFSNEPGSWTAYAFASAAALNSYLNVGGEGWVGTASGVYNEEPVTVDIEDDGDPVVSFLLEPVNDDNLPFNFEIATQTVQADNSPNVMLRLSRDRGKTWGTEMWRTQSGNGQYICRTRWTGIGSAFGIVMWFRFVANQYVSFRGVRVYAEGGG